jgi:hypothetical protein
METKMTRTSIGFRAAVVAAVCLGLAAGAASAADSLFSKAGPEDQALYTAAKANILKEAQSKPLELAKTNEAYFWRVSARTIPLMKAHAYGKDPELLEAFVPLMKQVLSQRYIHPTKPEWSGWFEYDTSKEPDFAHLALIDHDTILYFMPVLLFAREVRADPALRSQYGEQAEAWLKDVEASIRAWDKRGCWHDLGDGSGWYSGVEDYPDPNTGELKKLGGIREGGVTPYNKMHALGEALTLAYQITGDEWYKTRLEKCAKFFRAHWRVDGNHAEWNYRDHAFASDYLSGKLGEGKTKTGAFVHYKPGYYALDVDAFVRYWDLGIYTSKADADLLIKTNLQFMYFGDANDPKFRSISGAYKDSGPNPPHGQLWTSLAHFSPEVRKLWKIEVDLARKKNGWIWGSSAVEYLTEMSWPVSWDHRYAKAPATGKAG